MSVLDDDTLHALWLQAVALYDTTPNPPPDFASVAATRAALRASGLVDAASFDVVVVAVMGHALHERGDKTLLDYTQARPQPKPARGNKEFCDIMASLMPSSPMRQRPMYDIDQWG